MRPTKTSTQRLEDVKPKSEVLKPKDTNQVQRMVSASVPKGAKSRSTVGPKAGLGVKGKGKDKDVKSGALALEHKVSSSLFSSNDVDLFRPSERYHK
jgi:hypothetical protein